ncbi:MAG: trehalose-phosphatase [Bradyrhizobiaceae bacterium]|nr:trehalose-phosphatase [Bradyrhizobiaceae bacterium]
MEVVAPSPFPNLQRCAILLDVDGTIVDLAPTPREVWIPPSLRQVLSRLLQRTDGAVALVSGRSVKDLDLIFAPLLLTTVGGHGAELRLVNHGERTATEATPLDAALKRQLAAIGQAGPGILVEDKGYSLALHYRLAPQMQQFIRSEVARICAEASPNSIEILPGKAVIEIKRAGFSKATGVRTLMTYPPFAGRQPIFIGDDTTDECVFELMPELDGLAISVGRKAPGVTSYFDTPGSVRAWLERLAEEEEKACS